MARMPTWYALKNPLEPNNICNFVSVAPVSCKNRQKVGWQQATTKAEATRHPSYNNCNPALGVLWSCQDHRTPSAGLRLLWLQTPMSTDSAHLNRAVAASWHLTANQFLYQYIINATNVSSTVAKISFVNRFPEYSHSQWTVDWLNGLFFKVKLPWIHLFSESILTWLIRDSICSKAISSIASFDILKIVCCPQ